MARFTLLDAGVIGLACPPSRTPAIAGFEPWITSLIAGGSDLVVPDVTRFEVRRELLRLQAVVRLSRLDTFCTRFAAGPTTSEAWEQAAEFWAIVRQPGRPAASPDALDADAILAGVAATLARPGDDVVIATTNVRHLGWFPGIDARRWEDVA